MNFNIKNITRTNILNMQPYSSARDEFKEFNQKMVFLDANENPFENGVNRYRSEEHTSELQSRP